MPPLIRFRPQKKRTKGEENGISVYKNDENPESMFVPAFFREFMAYVYVRFRANKKGRSKTVPVATAEMKAAAVPVDDLRGIYCKSCLTPNIPKKEHFLAIFGKIYKNLICAANVTCNTTTHSKTVNEGDCHFNIHFLYLLVHEVHSDC